MTDQYSYAVDNSIIIQDGNMIWSDASHDQSSLHFMDANDTIITDSTINESYATAIDSNETQYLSILDSSGDVTLENMNLSNLALEEQSEPQENTVFSEEMVESNEVGNDEPDSSQVIVFTVDGSDDLYGIQLTPDQEGNIQKYQFKFRTTDDGNLEAIPETIRLITSDEDAGVVEKETEHLEVQSDDMEECQSDLQEYFLVQSNIKNETKNDQTPSNEYNEVFIKGEPRSPLQFHQIKDNQQLQDDEIIQDEEIDIDVQDVNIKSEMHENHNEICYTVKPEYIDETMFNDGVESHQHLIFDNTEEVHVGIEQLSEEYANIQGSKEQHEIDPILECHETIDEELIADENIEVEFQNEPEELEEVTEPYNFNNLYEVPVSENDKYQITEEYDLNEDTIIEEPDQFDDDVQTVVETHQAANIEHTNILKHSIVNTENNAKNTKPYMNVKCYIVFPEKENVNSMTGKVCNQAHFSKIKSNPRSVLRSSFMKPKEVQKIPKNDEKSFPECDLFQKRFAKSKEAVQAKLFHNFINRTTIPQAPIRQTRQPRKQEIKPVSERRDEEIIVQEVMISSNGFIETLSQKLKTKKFQVTAIVELSDSEDDSNLKSRRLSRTTSESEISVVEICSDDDGSGANNVADGFLKKSKRRAQELNAVSSEETGLKRRRGRPPKNRPLQQDIEQSNSGCRAGIKKIIDIEKTEIACPRCSKTFPSQNSLNTHLIHHNLENSLKNKTKMNSRQSIIPRRSVLPIFQYNHKCDDCQQNFKNNILLQRHDCLAKQTSKLNCSVCLKQFRDVILLNIHKKTHIKSNMVKNTSIVKVTPKKSLHRPSTSFMKSPKMKPLKSGFKCKVCPKVCDSEASLIIHSKMHKRFLCSSCPATFSSRLLLDTHVRTVCVKYKSSPVNKRLSLKIRKSFIHTPPKRISTAKFPDRTMNSTLNQTINSVKLECEMCKMKFLTYRNLFTHKVQKHGVSTPDKTLMNKPKQGLYKPKAVHGGIPANDRMKKAFEALRMKLAESEQSIVGSTAPVTATVVQ